MLFCNEDINISSGKSYKIIDMDLNPFSGFYRNGTWEGSIQQRRSLNWHSGMVELIK